MQITVDTLKKWWWLAASALFLVAWVVHAEDSHQSVETVEQAVVGIEKARVVDEAVLRTLCSMERFTEALECVKLRLADEAREAEE